MGLCRRLRAITGMLLLAGCAGIGETLKPPEIHLDRVVLRGLNVTGGVLDLQLGVLNPNRFDLQGTKLQVGFDVQRSHVGDIEYRDEFQMQKGDTAALSLPLRFNWSGGDRRGALGAGAGGPAVHVERPAHAPDAVRAARGAVYQRRTRSAHPAGRTDPHSDRPVRPGGEESPFEH